DNSRDKTNRSTHMTERGHDQPWSGGRDRAGGGGAGDARDFGRVSGSASGWPGRGSTGPPADRARPQRSSMNTSPRRPGRGCRGLDDESGGCTARSGGPNDPASLPAGGDRGQGRGAQGEQDDRRGFGDYRRQHDHARPGGGTVPDMVDGEGV